MDRRQHPLYAQSGQYGPCSCFYPSAPLPKLLPVWCYHGPGHTLCCSYPTLTAQAVCLTQLTLLGPLLAKRTDCCHSCTPRQSGPPSHPCQNQPNNPKLSWFLHFLPGALNSWCPLFHASLFLRSPPSPGGPGSQSLLCPKSSEVLYLILRILEVSLRLQVRAPPQLLPGARLADLQSAGWTELLSIEFPPLCLPLGKGALCSPCPECSHKTMSSICFGFYRKWAWGRA